MLARHRRPARGEGEVNHSDAGLWPPWLRINRVLRVMLRTHWSAEAWSVVRVEFRKALALRSEIRRAGWFNWARDRVLLVRRRAGVRPDVQLDSRQPSSNRGAHAIDRALDDSCAAHRVS